MIGQTSLLDNSFNLFITGVVVILGIGLVTIVHYYRRSKERAWQKKLLIDDALENISQGLCMYAADSHIVFFNERYAKMTGQSVASLEGRSLLGLLKLRKDKGEFDGDPEAYVAHLVDQMREGNSSSKILQTPTGRTLRIVDSPLRRAGWVTTVEDITDWSEAQAQLSHMARHDALTNLPNRTLFREQLELALRRTSRNEQVAVFCLDLDHFKDVNDSLGHPTGDELLKAVAQRLSDCVRESDTVARLGGDEFAIVQVGIESQPSEITSLASRLVEIIGMPYDIQGQQVVVGTSIGISVAPADGNDPDQLLKNADMALYLAKSDGRGAYRFFEMGLDARAQARRVLMQDMRAALSRGEFEVHYQPIFDLESQRIMCFEALVRWNHPVRGMTEPTSFIPLAEETGLIVPIGDFVLRKACLDAANWQDDVSVAVNLSPIQFKNRNLVPSIVAALTQSGLPARRLELEITESVLLQDSETTLTALHQLREFGIRISMDDFGTGYSSLSYLRSFPFDKIKIDQSFVRELASHGDAIAIVRAVTGLGKSLGIATVAEGVETNEQVSLLRAEGCTEVQGFLFSKARSATEIEKMMSSGQLQGVA